MIKHITSIVTRVFIFVTCALGCGGFVSGESSAKPLMGQEAPQEISDVMQVHREIIAIREAMLEETEQSHRSGRADSKELSQARVKLAEARLHLAEAQEEPDEAARELRTILAIRQETLDTLKHRRENACVSQHDLHEAHIAVLEAGIHLTRCSQATT